MDSSDMSIAVCFLVHANLQYAEIPSSETKALVEKSYIPTLNVFLNHPEIRCVIDVSGVTLESLEKDYPEVIEKLRLLLKNGNIEMCAGTYSSPILPLIPLDHARKQITMFYDIFERLFGDLKIKPVGFFPHEYFFDASLISLFKEFGFSWIPVNSIQYINSISGRLNNPLKLPLKQNELEIRDYHGFDLFNPIKVLGTEGATIGGLIISGEFYELAHDVCSGSMSWKDYSYLLDNLSKTHNDNGSAFMFLGPSDLEFVGYYAPPYSNRVLETITPEAFEKFILNLKRKKNIVFRNPSRHLKLHPPKKEIYLKCGGDNTELDFWTKDPDNYRLNLLCQDATRLLELAELKLSLLKNAEKPKKEKLLDEAWKALMLSENADGRGWMPIPERRLFCYEQVVIALRKAQEILKTP